MPYSYISHNAYTIQSLSFKEETALLHGCAENLYLFDVMVNGNINLYMNKTTSFI